MRQKLRDKLKYARFRLHRKQRVRTRFLILAALMLTGINLPRMSVKAESCPDVKIIFARGSGADAGTNADYLSFKENIESKLMTTALNYEFIDLEYPAVGVGIDNLGVALGALFSGGEAYEFGESVDEGVRQLMRVVNGECRDTKYVLGGYSQGAMVISKALGSLNAERVIYAATFGDPKIYLPEGNGIMPAACRGENLSDYRMYVPDCQAYKGLLGAYIPYEPEAYTGKVGTWCNRRDIFCSSHLSVNDHTSYVADDLYEDASKVIFDKIAKAFGIENHISSPHDTAILIDSTGSMYDLIVRYKKEALRLAKETLDSGGRVALYDYRDLGDPYEPVQHCNFETCTLELFETALDTIQAYGGGDRAESLLSASFQAMNELEWRKGSTKSLVVLTDADYLSPDRDGIVLSDVVKLSKLIDPVNFYIITEEMFGSFYESLAAATDGKVVTDFNELSLLTDYIIERYDSLPRVEETETETLPELAIMCAEWISAGTMKISFTPANKQTLVIVNDVILGVTSEAEITISELNEDAQVMLVPVGEERHGLAVAVMPTNGWSDVVGAYGGDYDEGLRIVPKAPNTGKA